MKKTEPNGGTGAKARLGKKRLGRITFPTSLSAVDMAILGALLTIASNQAAAQDSTVKPVRVVPTSPEAVDGEAALKALTEGGSAEVLALSALAGQMLREMQKHLGTLRFSSVEGKSAGDIDWGADPTVGDWKFSTNLPNFARSIMSEDGDGNNYSDIPEFKGLGLEKNEGGLNDPEAYRVAKADGGAHQTVTDSPDEQRLKALDDASREVLEIVRELFKSEVQDVMARVDPDSLDGTELAEIDYKEVTAEDVEGFGFVPIIAGGGGGGVSLAAGGGMGGFAIDGYVSGATVFWDINGNFILEAELGEVSTTTGADGSYFLSGVTAGVGQIVVLGDGIDTNTGGSVGMMAASTSVADEGAAMITPLTLMLSQGLSQDSLKIALGLEAGEDIDLRSFDPMATLTAAAGGEADAGRVLLQAQQLFAAINSISNLAAGTSGDQANGIQETVAAIAQAGVENFIGEAGGDAATITSVITNVAAATGVTIDAELAASAASAIKGVNTVIGEYVRDPAQALSTDARAAALVSQNELVSQFKAIAALPDPVAAKASVLSKLSGYADAEAIKTNFVALYKDAIQAQDQAGKGVVAGVDDFTLTVGQAQTLDLSRLLANDRNLGDGTLKVVAIEPVGLDWSTAIEFTRQEEIDEETEEVLDSWFEVDLSGITGEVAAGALVKLVVNGMQLQVQVEASDLSADPTQLLSNLANKFAASAPGVMKWLDLSVDETTGAIQLKGVEGRELETVSLLAAKPSGAVSVSMGDDGKMVVTLGEELAGLQTNLKYVVSNGDGQGVGIVRITATPQLQELVLKDDAPSEVDEDGSVVIGDRVELEGTLSPGVSQAVAITLASAAAPFGEAAFEKGDLTGLLLRVAGQDPIELKLGRAEAITVPDGMTLTETLAQTQVDLPENYKGDFTFSYRLLSSKGSYVTSQTTDADDVTAVGVAEGDTPTVEFGLGSSDSFAPIESDTIIPLVAEPTVDQVFKLRLSGGDVSESRWVEITNLPDGLDKVYVTFAGKAAVDVTSQISLGSLRINEPADAVGEAFEVRIEASDALVDSSFGLTETPIRVQAFNQEVAAGVTASSQPVEFNFDIGGAYGLIVLAQPLTESLEDTVATLGGLDVASVLDGATVEATLVVDSRFVISGPGGDLTPASTSEGLSTYLLNSSADQSDAAGPLGFLDGLKLNPPTNFKTIDGERVAVAVQVRARDPEGGELSLVEKTLEFTFEPQADAVTYDLNGASVDPGLEDSGLLLRELFFDAGIEDAPLAVRGDEAENLYYVVRGLPAGTRLISAPDEASLQDPLFIQTANAIGRISGDDLILTPTEAYYAALVMGPNQSLDASQITLFAYSQEPGTASVSEYAPALGNDVSVQIDAVADTPVLSLDGQVRGLVETTGLAAELVDKTKISIPASAFLQDTDGSESLWLRVRAVDEGGQAVAIDGFAFSGLSAEDGYRDDAGGAYYLNAAVVNDLVVTRPELAAAFKGEFWVEAIAIEGLSAQTAEAAAAFVAANPNSNLWAASDLEQTGKLAVEFLRPAKPPAVTLGDLSYSESVAGDGVRHTLDFALSVSPQEGDLVTVLMTGVPYTATGPAKFYALDADGAVIKAIGAPAEVDGVWVFDYSSELASAASIQMQLPPNYAPSLGAVFDVTAFAVDSLGLTNAKSELKLSGDISLVDGFPSGGIPGTALDPVIIDTAGDGLSLQAGPVSFDLNADGAPDSLVWTTADSDDAFLVIDTDGRLDDAIDPTVEDVTFDGRYLVTEFLDREDNPATGALDDLRAIAELSGAPTILDQGDLEAYAASADPAYDFGAGARLWFDRDADGVVDVGEMEAIENFSLDLGHLTDNITRDATGASLAGGITAGGVSGDSASGSLDSAVLHDVFLPVELPASFTTNASIGGVTLSDVDVVAPEERKYFEDNLAGFDLSTVLSDGISLDEQAQAVASSPWVDEFSQVAWDAILNGANVLLTVAAKQSGISFNLSQGARLEGQPRDTWLMLWDPKDPASLEDLKLFTRDDFSGALDLEFRATVVYTENLAPASFTVARDVSLDITAVSDRPLFRAGAALHAVDGQDNVSASATTGLQESVEARKFALKGITLEASDVGESTTLTVTPVSGVGLAEFSAAKGFKLFAKGEEVTAEANGSYVLSGPLSAGDVWVEVPGYASGRFGLSLQASSVDGPADASLVNSSITFNVAPVAQAPIVEVALTPGATEAARGTPLSVTAELQDQDGSEEISSVRVRLTLDHEPQSGAGAPTLVTSGGESVVLVKVGSTGLQYEALLAKSQFSSIGADGTVTLTGVITTPQYYDGSFTVTASATSIERADISKRATSTGVSDQGEVAAVAQDLDQFDVRGASVVAGERITLDRLVSSLSVRDADESVQLDLSSYATISGRAAPLLSLYHYQDGIWEKVGEDQTSYRISPISYQGLATYAIATGDQEPNFGLSLTASTIDGGSRAVATAASTQTESVNIASTPLYPPEVVTSAGGTFNPNAITMQEGEAGFLDLGVLVGNRLNPSSAEVTITGLEGFNLTAISTGQQIAGVDGTFTFSAGLLSKGLQLSTTAPDFIGSISYTVAATTDYSVNGQASTKESAVTAGQFDVIPVTDGVTFVAPQAGVEDVTTWSLTDIVRLQDARETVESVTILASDNVEYSLDGASFAPLNGTQAFSAEEWQNVTLRTAENFSGSAQISLSVVSQDLGDGVTPANVGERVTQVFSTTLAVAGVSDDPTLLSASEDLLQIYTDSGRTDLLTEAVEVDPASEQGASFYLSLGSFAASDASESASLVLAGRAIVKGAALHVPAVSSFATVYEAVESTTQPGRYEITIPGDGASFAGMDGTLVLPNNPSLIGRGDITAYAATTDGTAGTNYSAFDKDAIEIQSSGLPEAPIVAPGFGTVAAAQISELLHAQSTGGSGEFVTSIDWLVRAPAMSPGQVLEIFGWHDSAAVAGFVDASGESIGEYFEVTRTDGAAGTLQGVRFTYDEVQGGYVKLTNLDSSWGWDNLSARVGAVDGYVDGLESSGVRYVYSHLASGSFDNNPVLIGTDRFLSNIDSFGRPKEGESLFGQDGDDYIYFAPDRDITEMGLIDGGDGRDILELEGAKIVSDGFEAALVDLNQGTLTIVNNPGGQGSISTTIALNDIEVVLGTTGDDFLVGVGESTESQVLRGMAGDDYIVGGEGADVLEGGAGTDFIIGGGGADTFLISSGSAIDVIDDLNLEQGDRVVFKDPSFDVATLQVVRLSDLSGVDGVDLDQLTTMSTSDQDWVLRSPTNSSFAVLLNGTAALTIADIRSAVVTSAGLGVDYDSSDPQTNELVPSIREGDHSADQYSFFGSREIEVPILDLARASEGLGDSPGGVLDAFFGESNNFDEITNALGVIADAKFERVYEVQSQEMRLVSSSIDGDNFVGFSGTAGDDILIADGFDSVLIGGAGGSDRLIGDSGDDILIAAVQSARGEDDVLSMQGGGGADLFVFANIAPDEVTDSLNAIYKVRIEDFNRDEGDRVVLSGFGDDAQVGNIAQIGEVTATEDGRFEQEVTIFSDLASPDDTGLSVVFDISFMRQFDSEFQLRLADFDAL
jgi:hypothetical protein